jgi:serine protease AprX
MSGYFKTTAFAAVMVLAASSLKAQKLSKDLANADALSNVRVIVQWNTPLDAAKTHKVLQNGGSWIADHAFIKASTYSVPAWTLNNLSQDSDVAYISPDRQVNAKLDYTAAAVNASYLWSRGYTGTGIGVAVIDSGMNASGDLTEFSNVVYNQDFTGEFALDLLPISTISAPDLYGHGQHVAGIIASNGRSSSCATCTRSLKGLAPGVNLINLRALNESGAGTDSTVIAAIEQAISLKLLYNIRVINLSLGRPVYESYTKDPLCQAVEQAWKAGIVVVVAAGNDGRDNSFGTQGYGTISAPGNDPYVITVGAMKTEQTDIRTDDLIASYSSKGPTQIDHIVKPDIVAPGNQVVSLMASQTATLVVGYPANAVPLSYYNGSNSTARSNAYFMLSGTSMATPVVSAAAADLLEARPLLTPDQVKALIMKTAFKTFPALSTATDPSSHLSYTSYYDIFTVGAGYLDMEAAYKSIDSVPYGLSASSPTAVYNPSSGAVTLEPGASTIWASQNVWDMQSVWGSQTVSGTKAVWGTKAIWGTSGVSSSESLWGTNAIWSSTSSTASTQAVSSTSTDSAESVTISIQGEP